ncbi:MAG TPA: type VI secretion system tube protein Hcp [Bryobacteraceae bacterium]|jgi:type VI secretion system secreted protein Hcp|nr:type VI secretion system tube protein Hcp [Bryobacteraceae bacterium]
MAQVDAFWDCPDIKGESTDSKHQNTVEIDSYNWGCSQASTTGSATAGPGAGKVRADHLHFRTLPSAATPGFFSFCGSGKPIAKATLYVRKAGGNQIDYITITLEQCLITSHRIAMGYDIEQSGGGFVYDSTAGMANTDDWVVHEYVSVSYGKLTLQYNAQAADGTQGAPVVKWVDFQKNTNG